MSTSTSAVTDDATLVAASRAGGIDAFARLVKRYQNLVCAVAFSKTGDRLLSEDIGQETFLTAWNKLDTVQEPDKLRSWLCSIARNLSSKALRVRQREQLSDAEILDKNPGADPGPLVAAITKETEATVWQALQGLPENYREPLILFYREDKSIKQVAVGLGLSEDAAKQRLARGRQALKQGVSNLVEQTLESGRPSKVFTAAVLGLVGAAAAPGTAAAAHTTATASASATGASASAAGSSTTVVTSKAIGIGKLVLLGLAAAVSLALVVIATRPAANNQKAAADEVIVAALDEGATPAPTAPVIETDRLQPTIADIGDGPAGEIATPRQIRPATMTTTNGDGVPKQALRDVDQAPRDVDRTPRDVDQTPQGDRTPRNVDRTPRDVEQSPIRSSGYPPTASPAAVALSDLAAYNRFCGVCHGASPKDRRESFEATVLVHEPLKNLKRRVLSTAAERAGILRFLQSLPIRPSK